MWSDQEKVIKYPFDVSRVSVCFCCAALYRAVFRPKWWNRRPCLGGCAARHCLVLSLPASRQLQAGSAPGNIHTDPAPRISETVSAVREWHAVRQYGVRAACGVERVVRSDRVGAARRSSGSVTQQSSLSILRPAQLFLETGPSNPDRPALLLQAPPLYRACLASGLDGIFWKPHFK